MNATAWTIDPASALARADDPDDLEVAARFSAAALAAAWRDARTHACLVAQMPTTSTGKVRKHFLRGATGELFASA